MKIFSLLPANCEASGQSWKFRNFSKRAMFKKRLGNTGLDLSSKNVLSVPLSTLFIFDCWSKCTISDNGLTQVHPQMQLTGVMANKMKNRRALFHFPILRATANSAPSRLGQGLNGQPRCVKMGSEHVTQGYSLQFNPLASMSRGLVFLAGSERCIFPYPDSPLAFEIQV